MPDPCETFQFAADRGDAGRRLDHILTRHLTFLSRFSRTTAQAWIEGGAIAVNGEQVTKPAARVREGAEVIVAIPAAATRRARPAPEPHPLVILYEDEALLVVDKPPGVVVHPSYKQPSGTTLNALLWRLRDRADAAPGIVTRLDKDTSGLVLVAVGPATHARLQRDADAGRIEKEYLAITERVPSPAAGRIQLPLARDPADRRRVIVDERGAPSETEYEVLSCAQVNGEPAAVVACRLHTGRTHQIRVHLAARGWPIAGDRVYGRPSPFIARQALHAWRLRLPHPVTREPLAFESRPPDDMRRLLEPHGTIPS